MPEQALGGISLGFGIVVEDKPSKLSNHCSGSRLLQILVVVS